MTPLVSIFIIILLQGRHNKPVEKLINISVPPTLKKQLMDDFEFIKRTGKVIALHTRFDVPVGWCFGIDMSSFPLPLHFDL